MSIDTPIGIAGLGRMGAAMARRFMSLGHPVMVWNRDCSVSLDRYLRRWLRRRH